jgi:hypothetical protein
MIYLINSYQPKKSRVWFGRLAFTASRRPATHAFVQGPASNVGGDTWGRSFSRMVCPMSKLDLNQQCSMFSNVMKHITQYYPITINIPPTFFVQHLMVPKRKTHKINHHCWCSRPSQIITGHVGHNHS